MTKLSSRRVVLYSSLDGEPITVIDLPSGVLNALESHGVATLAVMEPPQFTSALIPMSLCYNQPKTVDVWLERYQQNGKDFPMIFTADEESALLLRAAFLPGQQGEVHRQRAQAYADGFMKALLMI